VQIYFYKVFQTDSAFAKPFKKLKLEASAVSSAEQRGSVISCLAFAPSGSHFCIGCTDSNVYIFDTSFLATEDIHHHDFTKFRATLADSVQLSTITAVSFGGQGDDERVIVGDRHGNVRSTALLLLLLLLLMFVTAVVVWSRPLQLIVSEPFRQRPKAFKMQWICSPQDSRLIPNPTTSVCCVSLFQKDRKLHAAASWKSDTTNDGKIRFFVLDELHVAAKAILDFPHTVSASPHHAKISCF
jgi:WD40 repeat protein